MTADRDAVYNESTDEEGENLPDPSMSAPGKINTFISFLECLTWAYYSNDYNHNGKSYEKSFSAKKCFRVFNVKAKY